MATLDDIKERIREFKRWNPIRAEVSNYRDLAFNNWLRTYGRPSRDGCEIDDQELGCFVAFDLDFVLYDYHASRMQILEVKTRGARMTWSQRKSMEVLNMIFGTGSKEAGVEFLGIHELSMSGSTPDDSDVILWDGREVSRDQAWCLINMIDEDTLDD